MIKNHRSESTQKISFVKILRYISLARKDVVYQRRVRPQVAKLLEIRKKLQCTIEQVIPNPIL